MLAVAGMVFTLTSCGSYQYAGTDNDGIYESSSEPVVYAESAGQNNNDNVNNSYYKNYFKEQSSEYDYMNVEPEVFTDVDSYEGKYVEQDSTQREQYPGWGQNNEDVTVNVYAGWNGFYDPFWNVGWGWNAGWGWGWNAGWGWGWNAGWGWGWNAGFYNPYWCGPYGYYGNPYFYNNPYFGRPVAYVNSRRGSNLSRMNAVGRRGNTNSISRGYVTPSLGRTRVSTSPRNSFSTNSEPRPRGNSTFSSNPRNNNNVSTPRPRTNTSAPRPKSPRANTSTPRPRVNTSSPRPRSSMGRPTSMPRFSAPRGGGGGGRRR